MAVSRLRLLLGTCLLAAAGAAVAAPEVKVLALFPGKAMLEIDGKRKVLAAGAQGPAGVVLVSADTRSAVVEIDGRRETLELGAAISTRYAGVERREIRLVKDSNDSYFVDGLVNGHPVHFLVDTGATIVAIGEREARRFGIQHRVDGERAQVGTAAGVAVGYRVVLDSVSVQGVRFSNVEAMVIEGRGAVHALLGMNVLSRFEIDQRENLLVLRSKR